MFVYAYVHTQLYSVKLIGTVKPSQIHKLSLHVLPWYEITVEKIGSISFHF